MIFQNPKIIQDTCDIKIGGVNYFKDEITYNEYIGLVEFRLLGLVSKFIRFSMSEGLNHRNSIYDCLELVYSKITLEERTYPEDEEGIVEEILRSFEYNIWQSRINNRFKAIHKGVVTNTYPISVDKDAQVGDIIKDNIDLLKEEDRLDIFLDGLASINYID
jgi:hypothetical protein